MRTTTSGGRLAIGALNELNPVWIGEGDNKVEAFSVKISVKEINLRNVNAYGPRGYDEMV